MKALLLAAGAALALTQAASAETATLPSHTAAAAQTSEQPDHSASATQSIRQQLQSDLQQAGFTEIKIVPDSFLVQAKDKSGSPVTMFINPDSVSEITAMRTHQPVSQSASEGGSFTTIPSTDRLSSNVVGLSVYNDAKQDIGTIKDVAMDKSGVRAYIVGVGGFLGMGDHYVAVNPADLHIAYNESTKNWHATMNATADQLKAAPEFKYSGAWGNKT